MGSILGRSIPGHSWWTQYSEHSREALPSIGISVSSWIYMTDDFIWWAFTLLRVGYSFSVREGGLFPCPYVECSRQVTTSSRGLHSLPVPRPGRANNYQQESETQWDENISLRYFWYGSRNPLLITTALAAIIHLPTKVYLQPPRGPQLTHVRQK